MSEKTMTFEMIARLFRYEAETGLLYWCARPEEDFPDEVTQRKWNSQHAGKLAGYINGQNNRRVIRIAVNGKGHNYLAYRIIWMIHNGAWPSDTIDHIDGDQSNDRINNLRDVPFQENCKNLAIQANNRTGVRGVSWDAKHSKWQARIEERNKEIWLGYFDEFDHAVIARKAAEKALGFHKNHGRAPRTVQMTGASA